ncbi:MAG: 3-phosphoshikimate 1-carboxyvinyltransferase [Chlamydiae bacterium]|nr:3-phosphoshikimate 1-carboxyvinyltransferase [Chlamydiota bacterium]
MTKFRVHPSTLNGQIEVPPSKSQSLRAILFASLAQGKSAITQVLSSPDVQAMIESCQSLGAQIHEDHGNLDIVGIAGKLPNTSLKFDAGNSGILLRFLSAVAACGHQPITISGDRSLCQRPMNDLVKAYQVAGVDVTFHNKPGFAPLSVQGPITGGSVTLDGADSQPVSALLIAGSLCSQKLEIHVKNPGEKPWVDVTLQWLRKLGVNIDHDSYHHYTVQSNEIWQGFSYKVPGDWSTAAFPIAAAFVTNSSIKIENVDFQDSQGDKRIVTILEHMGADIKSLEISPNQTLQGIEVDINDCIDVLPILSVIACTAKGKTRIKNASVAKTKECDRIACVTQELQKMGAKICEHNDGVEIEGTPLHGANLNSHGDHRMAMALVVAALGASSPSTIENIDCIAKTYPRFFEDFVGVGAHIERML